MNQAIPYIIGMMLGCAGSFLHLMINKKVLLMNRFNLVRTLVIGIFAGYMVAHLIYGFRYDILAMLAAGYFSEYFITEVLKKYSPYNVMKENSQ